MRLYPIPHLLIILLSISQMQCLGMLGVRQAKEVPTSEHQGGQTETVQQQYGSRKMTIAKYRNKGIRAQVTINWDNFYPFIFLVFIIPTPWPIVFPQDDFFRVTFEIKNLHDKPLFVDFCRSYMTNSDHRVLAYPDKCVSLEYSRIGAKDAEMLSFKYRGNLRNARYVRIPYSLDASKEDFIDIKLSNSWDLYFWQFRN